ncbi:PD-(D/E)XK nuclease family protein [Desulfurobacterium sp.]
MKYGEIPEFIVRKLDSGNPYIAVRESSAHLLLEICKRRKKPLIGKTAGTLQELAIKLIQKTYRNPGITTEQERLFIVREAIRKAGIPHWKSPSYVEIVDNRIRELKEHNISVNMLRECAKKLPPHLSRKLEITAKILKYYNQTVKQYGKYDIFSLFETARGIPPSYDEIILFFLPQILPAEIEFLNSLKTPISVLTFKSSISPFSKLSTENLKLLKNWNIIEVEPSETARNFSFTPLKKTTEIKMEKISYSTESEGIKVIAGITKKLLTEGIPPEKIAISSRNIEGKEILFYEAFKEYGIPFFSQYRGIPVNLHPAVKKAIASVDEEKRQTLQEWCRDLKASVEGENPEEKLIEELEILYRETKALTESGITVNENITGKDFLELLKLLLKNRTFLLTEEEPFGVFVGTPENIPSIFPEYILFYDFSSGTYPRSFPFDPDFSYEEREKINRALNLNNLILEALPGREKLILYEFQTFYNILSIAPEKMIFAYHKAKGASTFLSILETYNSIPQEETRYSSAKAEKLLAVYKNEKQPELPIEWGILRWKEKIQGAKEMNFIFNQKFISGYLPDRLSVTDVISYFDCPTEFFFQKIVGHKGETSLEAIEGQIYHEFIKRYFSGKENAEALFEEIFNQFADKTTDPRLKHYKPFIKDNLLKFIEIWQPDGKNYEQEKPLKINLGNTLLSGRADWIEIDEHSVKIIDFKRGNVTAVDYDPGKTKSFQIILYGLSVYNSNVIKAVKAGKHKEVTFKFISIPAASKRTGTTNWIKSFDGANFKREIIHAITWIVTGCTLIEKGFFPPLSINPYKPTAPGKKRLSLKHSRNCPYVSTLSGESIEEFREKIEEIFKLHYSRLWSGS